MYKFKSILKLIGLIVSLLIGLAVWFYVGSILTGLFRSSVSDWACFAFVLIGWGYLRVTINVVKVLTNAKVDDKSYNLNSEH